MFNDRAAHSASENDSFHLSHRKMSAAKWKAEPFVLSVAEVRQTAAISIEKVANIRNLPKCKSPELEY